MRQAKKIVESIDDVQAVSLLKKLNRTVFEAVQFDDLKKNIISIDGIDQIGSLTLEQKKTNLDSDQSGMLTRNILTAFANDSQLAPLLVQCWEEIENDDAMFVEAVIALGLVANLTLFLATTNLKVKFKNVDIEKKAADPDIIREVLTPITEFVKLWKQ
jgi:hypothetical protein